MFDVRNMYSAYNYNFNVYVNSAKFSLVHKYIYVCIHVHVHVMHHSMVYTKQYMFKRRDSLL